MILLSVRATINLELDIEKSAANPNFKKQEKLIQEQPKILACD